MSPGVPRPALPQVNGAGSGVLHAGLIQVKPASYTYIGGKVLIGKDEVTSPGGW